MGWRKASIMEQRYAFAVLALAEDANIAALCRRFEISRETGYKWIERFKVGGKASLEDQVRHPRTSPEKTDIGIEVAVLRRRRRARGSITSPLSIARVRSWPMRFVAFTPQWFRWKARQTTA